MKNYTRMMNEERIRQNRPNLTLEDLWMDNYDKTVNSLNPWEIPAGTQLELDLPKD